jgi:hypothetical protein
MRNLPDTARAGPEDLTLLAFVDQIALRLHVGGQHQLAEVSLRLFCRDERRR